MGQPSHDGRHADLRGPLKDRRLPGRAAHSKWPLRNLRSGYLRKNGVPFSANTVVNEYYDYQRAPNGTEWFTVTTVVTDPTYLRVPWVTSTDFRKQADAAGWDPSPCSAR